MAAGNACTASRAVVPNGPIVLSPDPVPVTALLAEKRTVPFVGLTDAAGTRVRATQPVSPGLRCGDDEPISLKEAISVLPRASSGELWAINEFVAPDGTVDVAAIKAVHGFGAERFEAETGRSLDAAAREARGESIVPVEDHPDIVDERRKALHALGYGVKFRWQIASDRYSIINPYEAYLPIVDALEQRGETEAFGWVSYRDWGGLLKLFVVCAGLEQTVTGGETSDLETDTEGLTAVSEVDDADTVVYGGFETGYDFRGTQTLWAKPIPYSSLRSDFRDSIPVELHLRLAGPLVAKCAGRELNPGHRKTVTPFGLPRSQTFALLRFAPMSLGSSYPTIAYHSSLE